MALRGYSVEDRQGIFDGKGIAHAIFCKASDAGGFVSLACVARSNLLKICAESGFCVAPAGIPTQSPR